METPDPVDRSLPSPWTRPAGPPAPYAAPPAWEEMPEIDAPAAGGLTPRLVLRALRRHWWQLLLLWPLLAAPLVWLVATRIQPTYQATAWLRVEPDNRNNPLAQGGGRGVPMSQFMQSQVQLITSPDVMSLVALDPKVLAQPLVRGAADPEAQIRRALRVNIPENSNLILVSMSSASRNEAPTIVNAVTQAYLDASKTWINQETAEHINQLRAYKKQYYDRMLQLREKRYTQAKSSIQADPRDSPQEALNEYRAYHQKKINLELEVIDAEASLSTLIQQRELTTPMGAEPEPAEPEPLSEEQINELVNQAFLADREAAQLYNQMAAAQQRLHSAGRLASGHDPATEMFRREFETAKRRYERLWQQKRPRLRQQVINAGLMQPEADPIGQQIAQTRIRLDKLRAEQQEVDTALQSLKLAQETEGSEAVQAQFDKEDLTLATEMHGRITRALEQAEYQVHGPARITKISDARPSMEPSGSKRKMMMAGAPVGVLGALIVLFVLLEVRGARVADPDELSSRLRLGVIGVVPPLPSLSPPKGPKALRDQRRKLEEFVQSLDHLRVTLCASAAVPVGELAHRCVLITSAVGGEGKTTLAAQLAGRCANAGLTTLLVDADLRRPSLGELLEVPEGPGLAEVLLGEATPEDAMVVIGNAGGFHLLPAGSGGHDPSRLLQGDRLGQLIARLREAFDIVLIDAPPVLPVPDALLIGRWTDGAVVAVRHDSSRFPLVERAQKRLTSIGVPLLGAVVNGVRPAESNYGAYDYYASTGVRSDDPLAEV